MYYPFTRCSPQDDQMFRPFSLGYHQITNLYRGNYTIYKYILYSLLDKDL